MWHVAAGDEVAVNQIIVEIETAKAAVELPSPYAGRVHALLATPGVTIAVGTPIIEIDTDPGKGPVPPAGAVSRGDESVSDSAASSDSSPGRSAAESSSDSAVEPAAGSAAVGSPEVGAKIGETMADGRVATLVGYIPAAGGRARRPKRNTGADGGAASAPEPAGAAPSVAGTPAPSISAPPAEPAAPTPAPRRAPLATPPVRKLAKDLGVDLASVVASRADGVISRADLESAAAVMSSGSAAGSAIEVPDASQWGRTALAAEPSGASGRASLVFELTGGTYDPATRSTRVPVKGVRKMTAAAMVSSAFTAPHVTEFLTVDVTPMMELRDRLRARREYAGLKITPLTFAARAVCLASRRTPEANATWDGDAGDIVYRHYVNLGIAAATPRGLIVPVVRDADQLAVPGLAQALADLTEIARSGKTPPADMTGGTITITNVGVFGVDTGTPIINPGEAAILALGSIKDAPWVVDGQLAVRKVCQLALSFDHRVMDGQQGSQFLADVGALLADPGMAMVF